MGKLFARNRRRSGLSKLLGGIQEGIRNRAGRSTSLEILEPRHYLSGEKFYEATMGGGGEEWNREDVQYFVQSYPGGFENANFFMYLGGFVGVNLTAQNDNTYSEYFTMDENVTLNLEIGGSAVRGENLDYELYFDQIGGFDEGWIDPAPVKITGTTLPLVSGGLNYGLLYVVPIDNSKIDGTRSVTVKFVDNGSTKYDVDPDDYFARGEIKDNDYENEQLCPCDCGCERDTIVKLEEATGQIEVKSNVDAKGETIRSPEESSVALRVFAPVDKQPLINVISYLPKFGIDVAMVEIEIEYFPGSSSPVTKYFNYDAGKAGKSITYDIRGNLSPTELNDLKTGKYNWDAKIRYYHYDDMDQLVPVTEIDHEATPEIITTAEVFDSVSGKFTYKNPLNPILGVNGQMSGISSIAGNQGSAVTPYNDVYLTDGTGNLLIFEKQAENYLPSPGDLNNNRLTAVYTEVLASSGSSPSSYEVFDHYQVVDKHGFTRLYSPAGDIIEQSDRNGNKTSYAYNRTGSTLDDLVITDPKGRATKIAFSTSGGTRTMSYTTNAQAGTSNQVESLYKFDSSNRLTEIIYPAAEDGSLKRTYYSYDPTEGHLISVTDKKVVNGSEVPTRHTTIEYDSDRRIASDIKQFIWDGENSEFYETDSMPIHTYKYGHVSDIAKGTQADPAPLALTNERFGLKTSYGTTLASTPEATTVEKYQSDAYGRPVLVSAPGQADSTTVRNSKGFPILIADPSSDPTAPVIKYEYDETTTDITSTQVYVDGVLKSNQVYEYGVYGQITKSVDEYERQIINTVDGNGNTTKTQIIIGEEDGAGNTETNDLVTEYTYTDGTISGQENVPHGLLSSMTDPKGKTTLYNYYNQTNVATGAFLGMLKEIILPKTSLEVATPGATAPNRSFTYDAVGNLKSSTDEVGRVTNYEFSPRGLLTKLILQADPDGNGPQTGIFSTFQYDAQQRITKRTDPNPNGSQTQITTNYTYGKELFRDQWLQFTKTILESGQTTVEYFDANRNLVYTVDALDRVSVNVYSSEIKGQLDQVILPDPSATYTTLDGVSLSSPVVNFSYDSLGRPQATTTQLAAPVPTFYSDDFTIQTTTAAGSGSTLLRSEAYATSGVRFVIVSNSNPGLFDKVVVLQGVNQKTTLDYDFKGATTGTAVITLIAYNREGVPSSPFTVTIDRGFPTSETLGYGEGLALSGEANGAIAWILHQSDYNNGGVFSSLGQLNTITGDTEGTFGNTGVATVAQSNDFAAGYGAEVTGFVWSEVKTITTYDEFGQFQDSQDYTEYKFRSSLGSEITLATYYSAFTPSIQIAPLQINASIYTAGGFIVAFYDDAGVTQIQVLDRVGNLQGQYSINDFVGVGLPAYAIATTDTGGFVVSMWSYTSQPTLFYYNSAFQRIRTVTGFNGSYTILADGGTVRATPTGSNNTTIQRYAADGTSTAKPFTVSGFARDIVRMDDGGFALLTWNGSNFSVSRYNSQDQLLDSTSGWLNSTATDTTLTYLGHGKLVLSYTQAGVNSYEEIAAYDPSSAAPGSFRVLDVDAARNVIGPVTSTVVTFSQAVNLTSGPGSANYAGSALNPANYTFDRGISIDSITALSASQVIINFTYPFTEDPVGHYTLTVKSNIQNSSLSTISLDQDRDGQVNEALGQDNYLAIIQVTPAPNRGANPALGAVSATYYDELNRVIRTVDAQGRETTIDYVPGLQDDMQTDFPQMRLRKVIITAPGASTDGSNRTIQSEMYYDEAERLVLSIAPYAYASGVPDARAKTRYDYDKNSNLTRITELYGTTNARITDYTYDERNQLTKIELPEVITVIAVGVNVTTRQSIQYTYDQAGQLLIESQHVESSNSAYAAQTGETGYVYDSLGRTVRIVRADPTTGEAVSLDTNPNQLVLSTAGGNKPTIVGLEYNKVGQVVNEVLANPRTGVTYAGTNPLYDWSLSPESGTVSTAYTYDEVGRLIQLDAPNKSPVTYTYDAANNVTSIFDGLNSGVNYVYDALNRVVSKHSSWSTNDITTTSEIYVYDQAGNLARTYDAYGRATDYGYDALGREVYSINAMGQVSSLTYDEAGNVASQTDAAGRTSNFEYSALGQLRKVYQPDALIASAALAREYKYDLAGNLTEQYQVLTRNTAGTVTSSSTTKMSYDPLDRLLEVQHPNPTTGAADPNNYTRYAYYDAKSYSTTTSVVDNTNLANIKTRQSAMQYDRLGRLIASIAADPVTGTALSVGTSSISVTGRQTSYTYDALDRQIEVALPNPGGTAVQPFYGYEYDDAGNVIRSVKPNPVTGVAWTKSSGQVQYDAEGRLVFDTNAIITDYQYDTTGALTKVIEPTINTTSGNTRRTTTYYRGPQGLVYQAQVGAINATTGTELEENQTTQYNYDLAGNLLNTIERPNTDVTRFTQTRYDALNRAVELIDARDGRTSFTYDTAGNRTSVTDAVGNTTSYEFDRRDRTVLDINQLQKVRAFAYDDGDRLTSRTDRNGKVREFTFDALDRLTKEQWRIGMGAVLRTFDHTYDAADQLLNIADDRGTSWTQDDLGLEFAFDAAGRITQTKQKFAEFNWPMTAGGSITPPANPNNSYTKFTFTTNFTFDQLDRRTKSAVDWSMIQYGNPTPTNYSEFENLYEYDSQSRLTNLRQQKQTTPTYAAFVPVTKNVAFAYNNLDRFTTMQRTFKMNATDTTWVESVTSDYKYDTLGRLSELKHDRTGLKALNNLGTTFNTHQYGYDALNRITNWTSVDGAVGYQYDGVGQLNKVDNPGNLAGQLPDENYQHDLNGNRWQKGATTVTTGENNQVSNDGTYSYEYDAEGNRTKRVKLVTGETTTYEYDHRNRMSAVRTWTDNTVTAKETQRVVIDYDALDRRVLRIHAKFDANGYRTEFYSSRYAYDGWDVILDVGGSNNLANSGFAFTVTRYMWAPHDRQGETSLLIGAESVDTSYGVTHYGSTNWVLADHQNTTRDIVRMNGTQGVRGEHLRYDAFGNYVGSVNSVGLGPLLVRYLYTGQEWDIIVGLHYYNHRWYDSFTGTFTTKDPIGWAGGLWNLSNYVGNDPVNKTDPMGLEVAAGVTIESPSNDGSNLQIITQDKMEELRKAGLAWKVKHDKSIHEHAVITTVIGNEVRSFIYKLNTNPAKFGKQEWALVGSENIVQFCPTDDIANLLSKFNTEEFSIYIAKFTSDKTLNAAFLQSMQSLTLALTLVPGGGSADAISKGDYVEAVISFAGDVATIGLGKIAKGAKALISGSDALAQAKKWTIAFGAIEGTIAVTRVGQAGYAAINCDNEKAAAHLGEAVLRIFGLKYARILKDKLDTIKCFPANTLVNTEHGLRHIQDIRISDKVWSYDFSIGKWVLSCVLKVHKNPYKGKLVSISTKYGAVTSTSNHPVWVVKGDDIESRPICAELDVGENEGMSLAGRWVNSENIKIGDIVFLKEYGETAVTQASSSTAALYVYNLTIDTLHNYTVGNYCLLVHNTSLQDLTNELNKIEEALDAGKKTLTPDEKAALRIKKRELKERIAQYPLETVNRPPTLDEIQEARREFDSDGDFTSYFHEKKKKGGVATGGENARNPDGTPAEMAGIYLEWKDLGKPKRKD